MILAASTLYYGFSFLITIIIMVIVAQQAQKKGHSPVLWAIFAFFCSLLALILVFVIKPKPGSPASMG